MKHRFLKTITRSLLLVTAFSTQGVYVASQEEREAGPAVVRGGGGLRRKSTNTMHASERSERLLANDDDAASINEDADDSASGGTTGGLDGYVSMVQNWESAAISALHDLETSANSTAWEFYVSSPSEWTQHQWDLVIDLLLGLFSICFLGTMCCVHICSARGQVENNAPISKSTAPSPLSPESEVLSPASSRRKLRAPFWSAWSPTSASSFFRSDSSTTASRDWSPKRSSRRHRHHRGGGRDHQRGGGRDRRRRLINSDDETTETYRERRSDDDESTDEDCTVESRSDQSSSVYKPPSFDTITSTIVSYDGSRSEFSPRSISKDKNLSKTKSGSNNEMPVEEGKVETVGVGTLASTKNQGVNVFVYDNKEDINKEECGPAPIISVGPVGVGALASTKNQGMNVFVYDDKEENVDQEKSAKEIVTPAAKISEDRDWKRKFQEWKKKKDDAAGEGTSTQRKSLLSPDYSGDWKSKKPPSLLLKSRSSVGVGSKMINDNLSLANHIEKARSPDSGVWKKKKPVSPHVDGRDRDTYEVKTKTGPEMPDTDVLAKCNKNKGTRREKQAGEVDGRNSSRSGKGHPRSSSDTDMIGGGTKVGCVEEPVRNVLSSSGEVTKRRRKKRSELV